MTQPEKKKAEEYRLIARKFRLEDSGQKGIVLRIETVKEFSSFQYEVHLRLHEKDHTLKIELLGLGATAGLLPSSGPAFGELVLEDIEGVYELTIVHPNGEQYVCSLTTDPFQITSLAPATFLATATSEEQSRR